MYKERVLKRVTEAHNIDYVAWEGDGYFLIGVGGKLLKIFLGHATWKNTYIPLTRAEVTQVYKLTNERYEILKKVTELKQLEDL